MSLEDIVRAIVREELAAAGSHPAASEAPVAAAPAKRGRGRPVQGAVAQATAAAPAPSPAAVEPDPFAAPAAPAAPVATLEEVRGALTALKAATTQDNALAVLKKVSGADNLTSLKVEQYGLVVAAAKAALPTTQAPVDDDPFATPAAEPEKALTLEDIKALVVETQRRTGQDTVQKAVMALGGKAKNAETGIEGPSLKALPPENYGKVAAALKALPTTK
jgi:hypothetical protein